MTHRCVRRIVSTSASWAPRSLSIRRVRNVKATSGQPRSHSLNVACSIRRRAASPCGLPNTASNSSYRPISLNHVAGRPAGTDQQSGPQSGDRLNTEGRRIEPRSGPYKRARQLVLPGELDGRLPLFFSLKASKPA